VWGPEFKPQYCQKKERKKSAALFYLCTIEKGCSWFGRCIKYLTPLSLSRLFTYYFGLQMHFLKLYLIQFGCQKGSNDNLRDIRHFARHLSWTSWLTLDSGQICIQTAVFIRLYHKAKQKIQMKYFIWLTFMLLAFNYKRNLQYISGHTASSYIKSRAKYVESH
jgi:hypothetical protein